MADYCDGTGDCRDDCDCQYDCPICGLEDMGETIWLREETPYIELNGTPVRARDGYVFVWYNPDKRFCHCWAERYWEMEAV